MNSDLIQAGFCLPPVPPADDVWLRVYRQFMMPHAQDDEWTSVARHHIQLVLAEAIQLEWDSKFKVPGLSRKLRKEIKLYGAVAHSLLTLISKVFLRDPCGYAHPAVWFYEVMMEVEAVYPLAPSSSERTKTSCLQACGRANKQLLTLEGHPFVMPSTQKLFDQALQMADQYDRFSKYVRDFARARSKVVTYMRTKKVTPRFKNLDTGKLTCSRQGRKSQS